MTSTAKRPQGQKKSPQDDGRPTARKRYFFATRFSIPYESERYIPRWMPRAEWEALNHQDRLRLKSRIPNDLPYSVSIRTEIPDPDPHASGEGTTLVQKCLVSRCSIQDRPLEMTAVPDCPVTAPVPEAHKEWRAFKEEDREDNEVNLKVPTWNIAMDGKFRCSACSRTFVRKSSLTRHLRTMHGDPPRPSSKLEIEEQTPQGLGPHTPTSEIVCGKCGQMFRRKAALEGHWRRQHAVQHGNFGSGSTKG